MNWQVGIEVGSVAQSIIPPTKPLPIGWPRNAPRLEVLQAIVAGYVGYSEATFGTGERQTVNDDNGGHRAAMVGWATENTEILSGEALAGPAAGPRTTPGHLGPRVRPTKEIVR